jgi:hypothetical protein
MNNKAKQGFLRLVQRLKAGLSQDKASKLESEFKK